MTKEERTDAAVAIIKELGLPDYSIQFAGREITSKDAAVACFEAGYALASNKWVAVTERMPDEPDTYFVYAGRYSNGDQIMFQAWCSKREGESKPTFFATGQCVGDITHWMPLPTAP